MNQTLRELLTREADRVVTSGLDLDELVGLGEHRLRRRRIATASVGATLAVAALALAIGLSSLGPVKRGGGPVVTPPPSSPTEVAPVQARRLLYGDDTLQGGTIRWGAHAVDGPARVHMDVTDDGFVYTTEEGRLWFSSGGAPEEIGSNVCGRSGYPHNIGAYERDSVLSGNAGSTVAWFECPRAKGAYLVVFDTGVGREVAREDVELCARITAICGLTAVVGDHVYFENSDADSALVTYDVATGDQSPATVQDLSADLSTHPRGLVVGGSRDGGTPTLGIGQGFQVNGSLLAPQRTVNPTGPDAHDVATRAFDTATGSELRLRLPDGVSGTDFSLFEWLDDDTVALMSVGEGRSNGEIITCRIPDGHCELAVEAPEPGVVRIHPGQTLPG